MNRYTYEIHYSDGATVSDTVKAENIERTILKIDKYHVLNSSLINRIEIEILQRDV